MAAGGEGCQVSQCAGPLRGLSQMRLIGGCDSAAGDNHASVFALWQATAVPQRAVNEEVGASGFH